MGSKYKVVGQNPVLGNMPGDVFEADIDPVQEERLVDSGALEITKEEAGKRKAAKGESLRNAPLDKLVKLAEEAGVQLPERDDKNPLSKEDVVLSIQNTPTDEAQNLADELEKKE